MTAALRTPLAPSSASTTASALACLTHPSALAAVLVLVANDHVGKPLYPGAWTGKLSDFAGVYFFPFLLCLVLATLWPKLPPRRCFAACAGITALWFGCAKATYVGHALTLLAVESALGPTRIALDPTDLAALVMLAPAAWLWRRCAMRAAAAPDVALARAAVVLACVACAGTSPTRPPQPDPGVVRFDRDGNALLARIGWPGAGPTGCAWFRLTARTSWRRDARPCASQVSAAELRSELARRPEVVDPRRSTRRIRALAGACIPDPIDFGCAASAPVGIEESTDAARSYQPLWTLPRAGTRYIRTHRDDEHALGVGVYDLAFEPNGERLFVALGSEGVIVIDPQGRASRQQVGEARPRIPLTAWPVLKSLARRSIPLGLVTAFWGFALFSFAAWVARGTRRAVADADAARLRRSAGWLALLGLLDGVCWLVPSSVLFRALALLGLVLLPPLALALWLAMPIDLAWRRKGLARCAGLCTGCVLVVPWLTALASYFEPW
jgi:hypothetical protein